MVSIPLAWLSTQLGRPAFAMAPVPLATESEIPAGDVLVMKAPKAGAVLRMPNREAGVEWEVWVDCILAEMLDMAPADLWALGPDRDELARRLLQLWGWLENPDDMSPPAQAMLATLSERLCMWPTDVLERSLPELSVTFKLLTGVPAGAADIYRENEQKRPRGLLG